MKDNQYANYRQYLKQLTENSQTSSLDYGLYVREAEQITAFGRQSSTLIFVLDYTSRHYPFMDASTRHLLGHSNEAFYELRVEYMLHHNRDFRLFNEDIYRNRLYFWSNTRQPTSLSFGFQ